MDFTTHLHFPFRVFTYPRPVPLVKARAIFPPMYFYFFIAGNIPASVWGTSPIFFNPNTYLYLTPRPHGRGL